VAFTIAIKMFHHIDDNMWGFTGGHRSQSNTLHSWLIEKQKSA